MLTSFAFFPGYTKGRLSHSLLETGLPGMCRQGAASLTPDRVDSHRCGQHRCLVAAASEKLLVPTSKTIRKSFLLFLLFSTSFLSLLSPLLPSTLHFSFLPSFSPPPSLLSPQFNPPCLSPSHGGDLPACEASASSWASSLSLQSGRAVFIFLVKLGLCKLSLPEVTHSLSEGMWGEPGRRGYCGFPG